MTHKVRPRRVPCPADEAAATLEYEFRPLGDALSEYRKYKPLLGAKPTPLSNATLEAFLLHARNLRSFFRGTDTMDDILAIDWLNTPTTFSTSALDQAFPAIHKLLAHPSYSRGDLSRDWPHDAIYAELAGSWHKFLDQLAIDNPSLRKLFSP
jgi:hypothetical protein